MKNHLLKVLFALIPAFCGGVFAFADTTTPSPTPTWAPVDASTKALLEKANALYYDYHRLGLHKFQCQVKLGLLDSLRKSLGSQGNDQKSQAIENLKFSLSYDEKTGFHFNYSGFKSSGDVQFDQSVMKIIDGSQKTILGYCQTWKAMAFEPAFDMEKSKFKVAQTATGYEVDESRDNAISYQSLDGKLQVTEVRVTKDSEKGKGEILLTPQYLSTPQGLLVNSISTDINHGFMKERIDTEYAVINHFQMPATVVIDIQMDNGDKASPGINYHLNLEFSNFQVN